MAAKPHSRFVFCVVVVESDVMETRLNDVIITYTILKNIMQS